jgi:hypothetical protein
MMGLISPEELVAPLPVSRQETVAALRAIVRRVVPDVQEAVRPGWRVIGYRAPLGSRNAYFGFVFPEIEHVHLGFEYGIFMNDPDDVLQGSGRKVRYATLTRHDEFPDRVLENLVREGVRVAAMSRSQRLSRLLDRDIDSDGEPT